MSLTGVTGTAGYVEGTAGVRLDTGATVSSSGPITVTGTAGSNAYVNSRGILTNAGSTIVSSGGSVTLNGTLNNPSAANGTAVRVDGQVQANGLLLVTGAATVGGSAGTGVDLGATGQLIGGPGGLTVTGSVSSATTATNIVATTFAGSATSGGNIAINGTVSAPSAVNAKGVELAGGSVTGTGAATLTVTGSGVPAPAPASSYDVTVTGTTLGTSGGEIKLVGDRMDIASAVNSGAGRTVITPFTTSRSITLGGSSETAALNLSASEINNITSSTLVLGGSDLHRRHLHRKHRWRHQPDRDVSPEPDQQQHRLDHAGRLHQHQQAQRGCRVGHADKRLQRTDRDQRPGLRHWQLRAEQQQYLHTDDRYRGRVAGLENGGTGFVQVQTGGPLAQTQRVLAPTFKSTSTDGVTLNSNINQIAAFEISNTAGDIIIKNSVNTTLTSIVNNDSSPMPPARYIQVDNAGSVTVGSVTTQSAETGLTFATAAVGIKSVQGISSSGGGTHVSATNGGSVYLEAGSGSVGASSANRVRIDSTGPIVVAAAGAGQQANLGLLAATVNLNKVNAASHVDIVAMAPTP
jgi:hypothetical protein